MGYEEEITSALGILLFVGVIIGFLLLCFSYLSDYFNEYNTKKDEEARRKKWAEEKKRNNLDFDVDFDINLSGSIVRTEVVYAE